MMNATAERERAVVPMVSKALEAAIVVLFIGTVTTALYAGIVPEYRSAAGAEVGDRALVAAAEEVEAAVPPNAHAVESTTRVDLPVSIRNDNYRVVAGDGSLQLEHPHPAVGDETSLALPESVDRVEGTWRSGAETVVRVESTEDGLIVSLVNR